MVTVVRSMRIIMLDTVTRCLQLLSAWKQAFSFLVKSKALPAGSASVLIT